MKVIGKGGIHAYHPNEECPHTAGGEELWSESLAIMLWDTGQDVYVFLHLTQEPNNNTGYTTVWLNAWTPEYTYHHSDDRIPFKQGDVTKTSLTAGDNLCRYEFDGRHHWTVSDKDVDIKLVMEDYHPGFGYYPEESATMQESTQKEHIEDTGWIRGTVTIKGTAYQVAGEGWRDHSWGKRDYQSLYSHRANYAIFGQELNFFAVTVVARGGHRVRQGLVVKGDTLELNNDFSIVAYLDEDGISHCGGKLIANIDGKSQTIEFKPVGKAVINYHQGVAICDSMCKVTMGDKVGVGLMETSMRAQGGSERPRIFPDSAAILENGIYPR